MRWSFVTRYVFPDGKRLRCRQRRRTRIGVLALGRDSIEILEHRILLSDVPVAGDPVTVTVSFQDGAFPTGDYVGTRDTKIRGDIPDRVFGTSSSLEIDGNPDIATLVQWDLSQVPADSTVLSATITVDVIKTSQDTFSFFEALQPWMETETTFNEVRAGVPWETSGAQGAADRGTTVLATITAPTLGVVTVDLNAAGLSVVQSWVANPVENRGFVIQNYENASTDDLDFRSRERSGSGPMFTLTYREGAPPPNAPPVADDLSVTTDEDSAVPVILSGSDPDGDALSYLIVDLPINGTLSGTAPSLAYTPNPDFHGSDRFRFRTSDGREESALATASITVNPINDRPDAEDINLTTRSDEPVSFALRGGDVDGDSMAYSIHTGPTHGRLDGTLPDLTYTPEPGFIGTDIFVYTVSDAVLESAPAEVSVTVLSEYSPAGIWIDHGELMALPTSGPAWDALMAAADTPTAPPNISDQDDNTDVLTLAKAIVGVRLGDQTYISQSRANIMAAIGTEDGGRTLALGRNLASYIIAADLIGLHGQDDEVFRTWLRETLTEDLSGRTLQTTHEDRPNNWGTMAGASRAAASVYLGDQAELERTATVFKGYLGDRVSYAEFNYGSDLSWQADPMNPVGINPKGAIKDGMSIDGVMPDDMRRGGSFSWPPQDTGYPWEGLQGALVQAEILHRAGYATYEWEDQALLRAVEFLYGIGWDAEGDDEWQTWLIDARYGTEYAANPAAGHGKIMGWTAWTHQAPNSETLLAKGDSYSVAEDQVLSVAAPGVLVNDIDPAGNPLLAVLVSGPANGALSLRDDGSFTYTPDARFSGSDSFTYRATGGTLVSNSAKVTITVSSTNHAPVAADQAVTTDEETSIALTLIGNDADGDALTYRVMSGPENGRLTGTAPHLTYVPNPDFNGSDSFTFSVDDGSIASAPATVLLTVRAVNDPPVAEHDSYTVPRFGTLFIPAPGVLGNDSDIDGDLLTAVLVSGPSQGTLVFDADGSFSYTPGAGFSGTDSFAYQPTDGAGNGISATVTITGESLHRYTASSEKTSSGSIVLNDYRATADADEIVETIQERRSGGRPTSRTSYLDHRWMFVVVDVAKSFYVTAARPNNAEGDDFTFEYSTDGGSHWTHLATIATPNLTLYPVALPAPVSGAVLVRVIDTDSNTSGNSIRDIVHVDQMYFSSEALAPLALEASASSQTERHLALQELDAASLRAINDGQQQEQNTTPQLLLSAFEIVAIGPDPELARSGQRQVQNDLDAADSGWSLVELFASRSVRDQGGNNGLTPLALYLEDLSHTYQDDELILLLAESRLTP